MGNLPLLLVRGALSDILSAATLAEMARRVPSAPLESFVRRSAGPKSDAATRAASHPFSDENSTSLLLSIRVLTRNARGGSEC